MKSDKNPWLFQIGGKLGCKRLDEPLAYLGFLDWLARVESQDRDWVTVGRSGKDARGDWATFSALAWGARFDLDLLFSTDTWDVGLSIGHPNFCSSGQGEDSYDDGMVERKHSLVFEPFVLRIDTDPQEAPWYELTQEFRLFHQCYPNADRSQFFRVDDAGDVVPVARIEYGAPRSVRVDRHLLRDYLATKDCVLVRYHDHRRFFGESSEIEDWLAGAEYRKLASSFGTKHFSVGIGRLHGEQRYFGRLLGKELILPYREPDPRHWGREKRVYEQFVYKRGDDGDLLTASCDQEAADSEPGFLTPVYFTRDVLTRYYAEPSKYRVDNGRLHCGYFWDLPIDVNDEKLIQVWLGDLGRLPHKHQLHWRQFNVEPRGGITEGRYRRDILAEWAGPDNDPAFHFHQALRDVDRAARKHLGAAIFKRVDRRDEYVSAALREPLTDEWQEFDTLLQALCKLTVESLNVPLIQRLSGRRIDDKDIKGSIGLLDAWLSEAVDMERTSIVEPLQMLQSLRSTGVAHRKGKNFDKALSKFGLAGTTNATRFARVLGDVTKALSHLAVAIASQDRLQTARSERASTKKTKANKTKANKTKASTKKASTKKASTKKASTKKASTKKASTKKASTRKTKTRPRAQRESQSRHREARRK